MKVRAFALLVFGLVAVLGWLISSPDPSRANQEALFRTSAPQLTNSFKRILEHSAELGVPSRSPASLPPTQSVVQGSQAQSGGTPPSLDAKSAEMLSELVKAPVSHEDDLFNRFRQAKGYYADTNSEIALGTMRELVSMARIMQGTDPRVLQMEQELIAAEMERVDRQNQTGP